MPVCGVLGCESDSKVVPSYTFHKLPRFRLPRMRWLAALGRPPDSCPHVCGRHFEDAMFVECDTSKPLIKDAVPTLFLPSKKDPLSPAPAGNVEQQAHPKKTAVLQTSVANANPASRAGKEQSKVSQASVRKSLEPPIIELPVKPEVIDDLLACRVCLAVDVPLYNIAESGLEDTYSDLTGAPLSAADALPRRLCASCWEQLSKCAKFRECCQRSHSLLQTLLERGPITIDDIRAIDRDSLKPMNTARTSNECDLKNKDGAVLGITRLIKNEDSKISQEADETGKYTEVDYLDVDYSLDNDIKLIDPDYSEKIDKEVKKEKIYDENDTEHYEIDSSDIKIENDDDGANTDSSDEIIYLRKKILSRKLNTKRKNNIKDTAKNGRHLKTCKIKKRRIGDEDYPLFNYEAFEEECNVKIKLLSKAEQMQEIEDRKKANSGRLSCKLCGKVFKHDTTLQNHLSFHDPSVGPHECEICRYRFHVALKLRKHRDLHRVQFTCGACGCVTRTRTSAKNHSLMHEGKTYTCPHCQQVYRRQTSYYNHVRTVHPGHNVACDQCGETFLSALGVRMHKALAHRPNLKLKTEFKCSDCDVAFLSLEALDKHRAASRGVSHAALCACAACGDSCGSDAARAQHQAERHPPDQHRCEECDVVFASAASFARHATRKHLARRPGARAFRRVERGRAPRGPVVCELCGKMLKNGALLEYHMNSHLSLKPYSCPKCPKAFAVKGNREAHMRVHTGERPYQCEQCPLAFGRQGNLARHTKTVHLNQRDNFLCDLCHKTFTTRAGVKLHVRSVHLNMPWPKRVRKPKKTAAGN